MSQILDCDWLPESARWHCIARSCKNNALFSFNKSALEIEFSFRRQLVTTVKIWSPDRKFWSPIYFKLIYEKLVVNGDK